MRRPLEVDVGQRSACPLLLHGEAGGVRLLNVPRRREAAWHHSPASVRLYLSGCRLRRLPPPVPPLLPQSSSAFLLAAGAAGFLVLSQWSTRPER